jgi:hypothetical protein
MVIDHRQLNPIISPANPAHVDRQLVLEQRARVELTPLAHLTRCLGKGRSVPDVAIAESHDPLPEARGARLVAPSRAVLSGSAATTHAEGPGVPSRGDQVYIGDDGNASNHLTSRAPPQHVAR